MARNMGSVFSQRREEGWMLGSSRSERRSMRGPEESLGGAMRVRRGTAWKDLGIGDVREARGRRSARRSMAAAEGGGMVYDTEDR